MLALTERHKASARATRGRATDHVGVLPPGLWFWRDVYALAKMDPLEDRNVFKLARARFGPGAVRTVASGEYGLTCDAALITDAQGRTFVGVRAGIELPRQCCLVSHELCEDRCTQLGYREPDREQECNRQARAIMAPDGAVVAAAAILGEHGGLHELASHFLLTDLQMALRLGEMPGGPSLAIRLTSGRIVVRDQRRRLPTRQLELRALFDRGGDAKHVLLPVSEPANGQVLLRVGDD